jgi:hypothetical protein
MPRRWEQEGRRFTIEWGHVAWALDLANATPGLRSGDVGPLLALDGVALRGRTEPLATGSESLVGVERHFDWLEATYAPADCGEMTIRSCWRPFGDYGIDWIVQLSARSVGELRGAEVKTVSRLAPAAEGDVPHAVVPRDAASAALSYDGREGDVSRLSTSPPGQEPGLWLVPTSGRDGWTYVEMVHSEDASRRIYEGILPYRTLRTGLFGYDLERGVVLRARLRGYWLPKDRAHGEVERLYRQFMAEPLPLST